MKIRDIVSSSLKIMVVFVMVAVLTSIVLANPNSTAISNLQTKNRSIRGKAFRYTKKKKTRKQKLSSKHERSMRKRSRRVKVIKIPALKNPVLKLRQETQGFIKERPSSTPKP